MHIHLPLSWDYFLFVWAPSSLRQVTGSCIHEGEACPDKTWIRDYQSARSRNGSPDKKRSKACRSVTDHFCEGGGNQGGTFSPRPPQRQHLKLHGIILGIGVFIAAQTTCWLFKGCIWTRSHERPRYLLSSGWSLCFSWYESCGIWDCLAAYKNKNKKKI